MKTTIYTLFLLFTISGDLVHLAYLLSFEHENVELAYEVKGENECEENKELGEDAFEIPSTNINLYSLLYSRTQNSNKSLLLNDEQFSRISTPPPDYS